MYNEKVFVYIVQQLAIGCSVYAIEDLHTKLLPVCESSVRRVYSNRLRHIN